MKFGENSMNRQSSFSFLDIMDRQLQEKEKAKRYVEQKRMWQLCWQWDGPKIGEPLEVDSVCAKNIKGETAFYYCAPCIAEKEIEPGKWIARIEYSDDAPEHCQEMNGEKLVLEITDIWAPVNYLKQKER